MIAQSWSWIWAKVGLCYHVSKGAQGNTLLLVFMLSRVEVSTSFSSPPGGGVFTTTSGAHRGVGYSVASFPGPSSSGALPTPQGNQLSVPIRIVLS